MIILRQRSISDNPDQEQKEFASIRLARKMMNRELKAATNPHQKGNIRDLLGKTEAIKSRNGGISQKFLANSVAGKNKPGEKLIKGILKKAEAKGINHIG